MIIVSVDSHVGPRLRRTCGSYCPAAHLDAFDGFTEESAKVQEGVRELRRLPAQPPQPEDRRPPRLGGSAGRLRLRRRRRRGDLPRQHELRADAVRPGAVPRCDDRATRARGRGSARCTTAGSPTSWPRRRIATSASPTCRCGTSSAAIAEVEWAHDHGLRASTSPPCATASCSSTTTRPGTRSGRYARSGACRSSPTSAAAATPTTRGPEGSPIQSSRAAASTRTVGSGGSSSVACSSASPA